MRVKATADLPSLVCIVLKLLVTNRLVARKVIRVMGNVHEDDMANEIRAVEKLCSHDEGHLLIHIFHHEEGSTGMFPHDLHQIDMELCAKNLREEIDTQNETLRDLLLQMMSEIETAIHQASSKLKTKLIGLIEILSQILGGLVFIHAQQEVHRDLKPENGTTDQTFSKVSAVLKYPSTMENSGFWCNFGRHIQKTLPNSIKEGNTHI
jgi:serine/threonine protein kinase